MRTFADWDDVVPGFLEADLVAHCDGNTSGAFLNTLTLVDIATGWLECMPLLGKSADDVIDGLRIADELLPFTVQGLDTDCGSEFINYELLDYCEDRLITLTRARTHRKNDQAKTPYQWIILSGHIGQTRKDPFENVWDEIRLRLELIPEMTARDTIGWLMKKYSGQFNIGQVRPLQRRFSEWRQEQLGQEARLRALMLDEQSEPNPLTAITQNLTDNLDNDHGEAKRTY